MFDLRNSILQEIKIDNLNQRSIRLLVKRDDLIHPQVSGNKWRKLKYNVELCKARKNKGILTFGGAFSNHLLATASACNGLEIKSIGVVRGDELTAESNPTLRECASLGMQLVFVSREEYKLKYEKAYVESLAIKYPSFLIVPEGGANYHGMIGCQEILQEIDEKVDHVFVPQGTSTTSCGLLLGLKEEQKLHVVPVLKGYQSIAEMQSIFLRSGMDQSAINELITSVVVHDEFHFGGYGKYNDGLLMFIREFYKNYELKLDPIYSGKLMFALLEILQDASFDNSTVLFVHTGGLQGVRGVEERSGFRLFDC